MLSWKVLKIWIRVLHCMIPSTRELVFHKVLQMIQTKLLPSNSIRKQTWMLLSWIQGHPYAAAHTNWAYLSQNLQVPSWTQQFFRLKLYLTNCSAEPKLCLSWERYGRHDRANKASRFCWSEHQRSCCDERCTQDVHMIEEIKTSLELSCEVQLNFVGNLTQQVMLDMKNLSYDTQIQFFSTLDDALKRG